jgi:cobalt-precorrin 5A hydrolase / precorrin-3B C17-methyltransferase
MSSKNIALIAPTPSGYQLALNLQAGLEEAVIWTKADVLASSTSPVPQQVHTYKDGLAPTLGKLWQEYDSLIFVLALGAVVRLIAPLLDQKQQDPGVVAISAEDRFVISVSGGHQGGADALARQVAALIEGKPIITSASASQQLPAVDLLGEPYGWKRGGGDWTAVATAITQQGPIKVTQTCGWDLWRNSLPTVHPFEDTTAETVKAHLWISDQPAPAMDVPVVAWHPRTLWVGIGCERGTSAQILEQGIRQVFTAHGLAFAAIAGLASVELKQDEVGLQEIAQHYDWPLRFFRAEELALEAVPNPSLVVADVVGTPSVAEAAAMKVTGNALVVPKQIYRAEGGACTVAVARATQEYSPRVGKLYLIGTGPGSLAQITPAARAALTECEVVIGYQLYVDLIQPLLQTRQIVEASPITQEVQRAERAIALAERGLTVGVISSGDSGIYGMAGLVLECLAQKGWNGETPQVAVLPGITALQALAARVGAPLMHDFCAISLSDLLTPWPVIVKRLEAAAAADFVVALYNPRSRTRLKGMEQAREIFLKYRSGDTPVALARSVYRPEEVIHLTTLEKLEVTMIDMLTVVLIGNQSTFLHANHLITPRGYSVRPKD